MFLSLVGFEAARSEAASSRWPWEQLLGMAAAAAVAATFTFVLWPTLRCNKGSLMPLLESRRRRSMIDPNQIVMRATLRRWMRSLVDRGSIFLPRLCGLFRNWWRISTRALRNGRLEWRTERWFLLDGPWIECVWMIPPTMCSDK